MTPFMTRIGAPAPSGTRGRRLPDAPHRPGSPTWRRAYPGDPIRSHERSPYFRPLVLVDKIYRMSPSRKGRIRPIRYGYEGTKRKILSTRGARPRSGAFFLLTRTRPQPGNSSSLVHQRVQAVRVIQFDAHGRR